MYRSSLQMEKQTNKHLLWCKLRNCAVFPICEYYTQMETQGGKTAAQHSMDELVLQSRNKPGTKGLYLHIFWTSIKSQTGQRGYICKVGRIWDGKVYPLNIGVSSQFTSY